MNPHINPVYTEADCEIAVFVFLLLGLAPNRNRSVSYFCLIKHFTISLNLLSSDPKSYC